MSSNDAVRLKGFFDKLNRIKFDLDKLKISFSDLSKATSATVSSGITGPSVTAHAQNASIHFSKSSIDLEDLQDVEYASLGDLEFLQYDLTNTRWTNKTQHEAIPETKFFIGTCIEKFHALVTSAGGVITLTLTEVNAGDLTMLFTDGYTTLATSGSITIVLTAGTDAAPQTNYIYILQSGKVLAKDTAGWPTAEHIKIGYFVVPSAAFVFDNNVYVNQNWNEGTDVQGHFSDMAQKMRQFGADYFSGIDPAGTSDYLTIAASNVEFKSGAGVVWQIHPHTFGAFDTSTGDLVLVKNWSGDSYHDITDLFDIVADSAGVSLANKWFTIVVWGIGNKDGELDFIVINLPSGSYTTEAKATEDKNNYTDFGIPRQYSIESSTGFLICEIVVKQQTTWDYGSTKDLRGLSSAVAVSGAVGTGITDHESLTSIGSNTHTQIDTHISDEPAAAIATHEGNPGDINHLTDAQVTALHAIFSPGLVTAHSDVSNAGSGIIISGAERTALHAIFAPGLVTAHSDVSNAGSGIIISGAERTALHAIYTDASAKLAAFANLGAGDENFLMLWDDASKELVSGSLVIAQLNDLLMYASANAAYINCPFSGDNIASGHRYVENAGGWDNTGAADMSLKFEIPLPTTKGTLKLYIKGFELGLADADTSDYVFSVILYGQVYNTRTTIENNNNGGSAFKTIARTAITYASAWDVSGYNRVYLVANCSNATSGELQVNFLNAEVYYL